MQRTFLDHVGIGTRVLADGWELFGRLLGGTWAAGWDSPGFWWGQLAFAAGPMVELLTPTGGPDGEFLERFLTRHGAGPHHLNFHVPDIEATLARVRDAGLEPVGVNLASPQWKEAFLHPKTAHGIVIQVAQQSGPAPVTPPPAGLPAPAASSAFTLVEHHVADLDGATALYEHVLEGDVVRAEAGVRELAWDSGGRLLLVQSSTQPLGALGDLHFSRDAAPLTPAELAQATDLAGRLGISVQVRAKLA